MTKIFNNAAALFSLKTHLVWRRKYHRPVLVGEIEKRSRELRFETAAEHEWVVETMEIMPNHMQRFVLLDPRCTVGEIVNCLKGVTRRNMRPEFRELQSRIPTPGSGRYSARTVGHVSDSTVRKYIESQKGK